MEEVVERAGNAIGNSLESGHPSSEEEQWKREPLPTNGSRMYISSTSVTSASERCCSVNFGQFRRLVRNTQLALILRQVPSPALASSQASLCALELG